MDILNPQQQPQGSPLDGLTAHDANNVAGQAALARVQHEESILAQVIVQSAQSGQYHIEVGWKVGEDVVGKLERKGFKVSQEEDGDGEWETKVSWKNASIIVDG